MITYCLFSKGKRRKLLAQTLVFSFYFFFFLIVKKKLELRSEGIEIKDVI